MLSHLALTTWLFLLVKVDCRPYLPVPLAIALDKELDKYNELSSMVTNVSMEVSSKVTNMSLTIYETCDLIEKRAKQAEESVARMAHALSIRSVLASECVDNAMIKASIDNMNKKVLETIKCMHNEANRHSDVEVKITTRFNHHHRHLSQGKQAMKSCFVTQNPLDQRKCYEGISQELKNLTETTLVDMNTLHSEMLKLWNLLQSRIQRCESAADAAITKLTDKLYLMEGCEGFSIDNK